MLDDGSADVPINQRYWRMWTRLEPVVRRNPGRADWAMVGSGSKAAAVAWMMMACWAAKQRSKGSWERASIRALVMKAGRGWSQA